MKKGNAAALPFFELYFVSLLPQQAEVI